MKYSIEQLKKFIEPKKMTFKIENYIGNEYDSFNLVKNITVDAVIDFYEDQADIDVVIKFEVELNDSNNNELLVINRNIETYFVVSKEEYEADYNVYTFEKNTLNLERIIKEEIYYDIPLEYSIVDSEFIDEDTYYYNEYQKIDNITDLEQRVDIKEEFEKIYKVLD